MRTVTLFIVLGTLLFSAVPLTADAGIVQCGFDGAKGQTPNGVVGPEEACQFCDIFKLITGIINFFLLPPPAGFGVVPLVATLLILVGGFYILIAAGRPDMQTKGKTIITAVVIGLLVVYIAWIAVNSILTFLGVAQWTGLNEWWSIKCD